MLSPPRMRAASPADTVLRLSVDAAGSGIPVAVLGGGDYTRSEIIPALRRGRFALYAIANREPQIAALVGREYGFALATTDSERAIAELPAPGLVIVATAHDSHTHLACAAVKAGHRVFLEKPPTVTAEDVHQLAEVMQANPGAIEIGFNRRYHPLVTAGARQLSKESGPTSISCVVKELTFQPDHWYFWPNQGTRITGNLCHWIDLAVYLIDGNPMPVSVTLSPRMPGTEPGSDEERVLTVTFEDGVAADGPRHDPRRRYPRSARADGYTSRDTRPSQLMISGSTVSGRWHRTIFPDAIPGQGTHCYVP